MNRKVVFVTFLLLHFVSNICTSQTKYIVHHQVTGLFKTNSYLLLDVESREGALFDVGGPIDSLESIIKEEKIKLKYIFITHCHADHVYGIPAIINKYPEARIGFSREEYEDTKLYSAWENKFDSAMVAKIKSDPNVNELMNFDYSLLGKPEIELNDNQVFTLGEYEIKTFLSAGHSRGSICFYTDSILLSGDVLFYRSVGRIDLPGGGTKEELVKSVRRLYSSLSDDTKVYPGHGKFTDIESEKKENKKVSVDGGEWGIK